MIYYTQQKIVTTVASVRYTVHVYTVNVLQEKICKMNKSKNCVNNFTI